VAEYNPSCLFNLTYGLYVVTSCADGKGNGQIANTDVLTKPVNDGDELHLFYILGGG